MTKYRSTQKLVLQCKSSLGKVGGWSLAQNALQWTDNATGEALRPAMQCVAAQSCSSHLAPKWFWLPKSDVLAQMMVWLKYMAL
jgi:hypothetical protein